jgi:hypothetical protein
LTPRGSAEEAPFGPEHRREKAIRKSADPILAFRVLDRAGPADGRPNPGEGPEDAKHRRDRHEIEGRFLAEVLEHRARIAALVAGVLVERGPQSGIRGDGQEDPSSGARQRRGDSQEPDVVGDVLDDVEQTDQVEGSGERRRRALTGDDGQRVGPGGGEILEAPIEAERPVLARQGAEDVAVSATELQNPTAAGIPEAAAHRLPNARLTVVEPVVPFSQAAEDPVTRRGEAGLESGFVAHG